MRLLIVEDELKIAQFVRNGLKDDGYTVDVLRDGNEAAERLVDTPYDAVLLDIMLPGRDGLSVLRQMRKEGNNVPVMLLSARGGVEERVEGLDLGADDYLSKPFSMEELSARLRALLRRASGEKLTIYRCEDLSINLATRQVKRGNRSIELTSREFALLEYLLRSPGRVFTRTQIIEHVWDYHFDSGTNIIDVYIQKLRRKIDDGETVKLIQTVRGVGYSLKAEA